MRVSEGLQAQWYAYASLSRDQRHARNPALSVAANVMYKAKNKFINLKKQKMKKQNIMTGSILCIILLLNSCGNKKNNPNQQNLLDDKVQTNIVVSQTSGTFTDSRDGKTYKIIKIGSQTWMAENLAYKANSGCWAYDNDTTNIAKYGYLYDWGTAKDVCPAGWHIPTDTEWSILTDYLGGESVAGGKLKEADMTHWSSPNTDADNSSGFTALPSGYLMGGGMFVNIGFAGYWWSATKNDAVSVWYRNVNYDKTDVTRYSSLRVDGLSVRCLRD